VTWLEPLLAKLSGAPLPLARRVESDHDRWDGVTRLVPCRVTASGAEPLPYSGSAMLRGAAVADGFLVYDDQPGAGFVPLRG
jgi:hypothetical protein